MISQIIEFALLGLGTGGIYAIVANGLVLVYRGSGILNFAQGAFVMFGGYTYYALIVHGHVPLGLAFALAIVITAALGAGVHLLILKPMRQSSPLARVVVCLAIMTVLQSVAIIRFGLQPLAVPSSLPSSTIEIIGGVHVGVSQLIIFFIAGVLTAALWAIYRYTAFGRMTLAVSENQRAAASLGHSPDVVATVNWAAGGALAGLAGALIAPITFLDPTTLILLILPAIAAGFVCGFSSFPLTFAAAIVLGIGESELQRFVSFSGWQESLPFIVVILILMVRGHSLPIRSYLHDRLPAIGDGRIRKIPTAVAFVVVSVFLFEIPLVWQTAFTVTITMSIICLSVVVVTGYAGQVSLAQYVLAGVAALTAAQASSAWHWPFLLALLAAVVVTVVVGALVALPSLRTRGINLAIATLGLATVAYYMVLNNSALDGGFSGVNVQSPNIFGWSIDPFVHAGNYAFVSWAALVLLALAVANIRRGAIGRRLIAVRSNERASAALGISVYGVKIYAFVLAAAIAAIGGVLFAFLQPNVQATQYDVLSSINFVVVTIVGGIGMVGGAFIGGTMIPGGVITQLLNGYQSLTPWLPLVSGILLIIVLRGYPDGVYRFNRDLVWKTGAWLGRRLRWKRRVPTSVAAVEDSMRTELAKVNVKAKTLAVEHLRVQFGGVIALDDVSVEVRPGEVHGLIGPNGAGKTTFIDAVTGFVQPKSGTVHFDGGNLGGMNTRRRARLGLARSFQSLELFDDLSVEDNLATACDEVRPSRYVCDLFWPRRSKLSAAAQAVVIRFNLRPYLHTRPDGLSYGLRRLVAIARAVAAEPSVLLLDEPAAGLGDGEAEELASMIRTLAQEWGIGILLVEHNVDVVLSVADRVTVLDAGSVLVTCDPNEVLDNPLVREAYLGLEGGADDFVPGTPVGAGAGPGVALRLERSESRSS